MNGYEYHANNTPPYFTLPDLICAKRPPNHPLQLRRTFAQPVKVRRNLTHNFAQGRQLVVGMRLRKNKHQHQLVRKRYRHLRNVYRKVQRKLALPHQLDVARKQHKPQHRVPRPVPHKQQFDHPLRV